MGVHTCIACMCVVANAYVCGEEGECVFAGEVQATVDGQASEEVSGNA